MGDLAVGQLAEVCERDHLTLGHREMGEHGAQASCLVAIGRVVFDATGRCVSLSDAVETLPPAVMAAVASQAVDGPVAHDVQRPAVHLTGLGAIRGAATPDRQSAS